MPNLIEVQKASYDQFLMVNEPGRRPVSDEGLQARFPFGVSDQRFFPAPRSLNSCATNSSRRSMTSMNAVSAGMTYAANHSR